MFEEDPSLAAAVVCGTDLISGGFEKAAEGVLLTEGLGLLISPSASSLLGLPGGVDLGTVGLLVPVGRDRLTASVPGTRG